MRRSRARRPGAPAGRRARRRRSATSVAETAAAIASHVAIDPQPEALRRRQEQREEEHVGRAEPRRRVLARKRERDRDPLEDARLAPRRRPASGPRYTDAMSTHGITAATSTTHDSASNSWRNQKPRSAYVTSLHDVESGVETGEVEQQRRATPAATASSRPRASASGRQQPDDEERRGDQTTRSGRRRQRSWTAGSWLAKASHAASAARTPPSKRQADCARAAPGPASVGR